MKIRTGNGRPQLQRPSNHNVAPSEPVLTTQLPGGGLAGWQPARRPGIKRTAAVQYRFYREKMVFGR